MISSAWLAGLGRSTADPPLPGDHMQAQGDPERGCKAVVEVEQPCYDEDADPDANGADADAGRESPDHPPPMVDHISATDRAYREQQADQKPAAEDRCGRSLG